MSDQNDLPEAAKRALAEAEERRRKRKSWNFPKNWADARAEPVRYGDWEKKGIAVDF